MFGYYSQSWILSFAFVLAIGCYGPADALDLSKPLPKLSAKEVLLKGPSHSFFDGYNEGVKGNCGPLLAQLKEKIESSDSDARYSARLVYAEMYDRAVCVEYSPEKSFKLFKQIADEGGYHFYAHVGWKYVYGHGVTKSDLNAQDAFKILLTRGAFAKHSRNYARYQSILRDRLIPTSLKRGVDWLNEIASSDDGLIELAINLIEGTGEYYDKSHLNSDVSAAQDILEGLSARKNKDAMFVLADAILKGQIASLDVKDAHFFLETAANCGNTNAMVTMAQHHQTGRYQFFKTNTHAYAWLFAAKSLGANVEEQMEKLQQVIKNSGQGEARQVLPWNYFPDTCRAE